MAEELYFFKLNSIKAKSELIKILKISDNFTYSDYLLRYTEDKLNYQEIVSKVNESIELLSSDEFWSISSWIYEKVKLENSNLDYKDVSEVYEKTISDCGMELFYEIPSKTPVRKFHSILWDYECQMKTDIISPLVDFKSKSEEFNNFLKYAICYTGELNLFLNHKYYKFEQENYNDDIQKEIDKIILNNGNKYHAMALNEFMNNQDYYIETINLTKPLTEFRKKTLHFPSVTYPKEFNEIMDREGDLISLAGVFYYLIELKEKIENYSGTVLMLHSY